MRADRLLSMMLLLQTRGKMTTEALARELEVSRRTVLRDINALSFAGIPIMSAGGHGGGVALDENYRTSLTGLQESEALTLFIDSNAKLLADVGLGEAAERTILKLLAALPQRHQQSVDFIRQRLLIDPLWWWHDSQSPDYWEKLQHAVYNDCCIRVVYKHYNGDIVEYDLEPYSLVSKSSMWYLVALRDGEWRTYRVSRFHDVELLDRGFQRREDFDLPTHWHERLQDFVENFAVYEFTLRIRPERVTFAKSLTRGRWELVDESSEWVTLKFQLESKELAIMLVFGLGADAIILEPGELQEAVQNRARVFLDG